MIASGVRLKNLVEFDSQRPYPRLTDFLDPLPECETDQPTESFSQSSCQPALASAQQGAVTAEEVGPVVDALRAAFGLDLFGFDVLVAPTPPSQQSYPYEWLVVDVNYFPSYKEVNDFPSLLAKYLTQRALQDRAHKLHSLALQRPVQDAQQYDHPAERLNELRPSHTVDEPVSH
jgi:inositol-1,3,4-trisphosphate 5/6-kinase/inositol-tetrakisphosphate 1-kinase